MRIEIVDLFCVNIWRRAKHTHTQPITSVLTAFALLLSDACLSYPANPRERELPQNSVKITWFTIDTLAYEFLAESRQRI